MSPQINFAGLVTGSWINYRRENALYFAILALIGRYLIQPYFAAVFLEAYLAAFFRRNIANHLTVAGNCLGKPKREDLSGDFEELHTQSVLNFYQLWMIKNLNPTLNEIQKPPLWICDRSSEETFFVLYFSLSDGWSRYVATVQGGAMLLFDADNQSLCHVSVLKNANIQVIKTTELESDGIHGLGITSQYLIIKIRQSLVGRSVPGGDQYHWWRLTPSQHTAFWEKALNGPWDGPVDGRRVDHSKWRRMNRVLSTQNSDDTVQELLSFHTWYLCSRNEKELEELLSKLHEASKYEPSWAVKAARQARIVENGLQAKWDSADLSEETFNLRRSLGRYLLDPMFEVAIAGLIVSSVVAKALIGFKPSTEHSNLIATGDFFFQFSFATEACLRLFVLRPRTYFSDPWCSFDWILIVAFYFDAILTLAGSPPPAGPKMVTRMQRLVKVCRILAILRLGRLSSIANLVNFLGASMSRSLGGFTIFLMVIVFSFSVVGTNVFGQVCTFQEQEIVDTNFILKTTRCQLIDNPLGQYESFANVEIGILTLLRVFTGNNWISVMQKCSMEYTDFDREDDSLDEAISLLRKWNATVESAHKTDVMQQVRTKLPGCQSVKELEVLRSAGLADCSTSSDPPFQTPCASTCGSWFAQVYFPLFYFVSGCIIFNLVMSSLYEGLKSSRSTTKQRQAEKRTALAKPIIKRLKCFKLGHIYDTWIINSNRKVRHAAMRRRLGLVSAARIRHIGAVLCLHAWKSFASERGAKLASRVSIRKLSLLLTCFRGWRKYPLLSITPEAVANAEDCVDGASEVSERSAVGAGVFCNRTSVESEAADGPGQPLAKDSDRKIDIPMRIIFQNTLQIPSLVSPSRQKTPDYVVEANFTFPFPPDPNPSIGQCAAKLQQTICSRDAAATDSDSGSSGQCTAMLQSPLHSSGAATTDNCSGSSRSTDEVASINISRTRLRASRRQLVAEPGSQVSGEVPDLTPKILAADSSTLPKVVRGQLGIGVAEVVAEAGLNPLEKLHVMRRALAMRPRNVPLLRHYAELLAAAGQAQEAETMLQRALEIDPRDVGTLSAYLALARAGGDSQAVEVLKDLLRRAQAVAGLDLQRQEPTSRAQAAVMLTGGPPSAAAQAEPDPRSQRRQRRAR